MAASNQEKVGWFKAIMANLQGVVSLSNKLAQEDPRRVVHAVKVGLAISLVSLFYYFDFLYEGFGVSAMWAVITVVVVFEFSVGGTLGKGVNRGIATFVAGALGVGAHRLAVFSGEKFQPLLLGGSVFFIAAIVTFLRFFPRLKARYDYGLLIFILTFCLISVSGYRDDEVLEMAHERLSTVVIGGFTAMTICIFICPVWAGQDLHNLVATNIDKLADFLQGFECEYFRSSEDGNKSNSKTLLEAYKSVLNSKSTEESLANFAKWEPRHGRFKYRHPWNQYLKVGAVARECAYRVDALNGYINSHTQTTPEIRAKIQDPCTKLSSECSKALKELAISIKTMTTPSYIVEIHITNAKSAAKSLKKMLKSGILWEEANLLEIIPAATMLSLVLDIYTCTLKIAESVNELARLAKFKKVDSESKPKQKVLERNETIPCVDGPHHVINVE